MEKHLLLDKKGCAWSIISKLENDWVMAIKKYDENGKKTYNWKPKRIKYDWLSEQ